MIKEIRRIKEKGKQKYIYHLINEGKLPKHINDKGYVCYEPEELKKFQKNNKRGRPPKIIEKEN